LQHSRIIFNGFGQFPFRDKLQGKAMPGCGLVEFDVLCRVWNVDMRILKITGAVIAAAIVVLALLLIVGIPSGFLTSEIQARVERDTGYRLTIAGSTRIGVWPSLNVTLNDVTLEAPKDPDAGNRVTVGSIQADVTLASLWSGYPQVTELVIAHPVVNVPLRRERTNAATPASRAAGTASHEGDANALGIDHVKIIDGTIVMSNLRDRIEHRIEGIRVDALIGGDRKIRVTGSARTGEHPLKFEIKATAPTPPVERKNIPVELTLDSGILQGPLAGKAEVRLNGSIVMINGLTGTIGDSAFNGWASLDLSSKPLVKLDLDFQRLDIAASAPSQASPSSSASAAQPWSNASIETNALNYVDAQVRISAAEINIGSAHLAPAAIDAALAGGVLRCSVSNLGAYSGQATGQLIVDASAGNPTYALSTDLVGVQALPLLSSVAGFDKLDGRMQAKIAVRSSGASQRAIMSNLGGSVFAVFQDGAIKGLNVAQMIRSLTASTLSGWQETSEQATDLTQFSASFRIDKGQATSNDLNLVGPLVRVTGTGTIDLGTKSLAFRVEPKLVMTTQGQGRASDPVGLGIPVMIEGPWAEPRIYPEINGILDNPDAAYAKLKDMGKGLFGAGGGGLGGLGGGGLGGLLGSNTAGTGSGSGNGSGNDPLGGKLGETLGNLFQQGLGSGSQSRAIPAPTSSASSPAPASIPPARSDPPPQTVQQDSPAMNDVLRQLFSR
jgi:AsmA protein